MVEALKHLFGFCGENHPNLLYLFTIVPIVTFGMYIKQGFGLFILLVKNYLKQLYK
jgi:hypothetical protein